MRGLRRLLRLLRGRDEARREVDEEIDFHLERTRAELERAGWSEREASEEARRRFGDVERHRRAIERWDGRRWRMERLRDAWDAFVQQMAFAVRQIRRSPGFAAAVVATLALGIGANAVMFGVVDRLLLSPPAHVDDPDDVRHLYLRARGGDGVVRTSRLLSYPDVVRLDELGAFRAIGAYASERLTLGEGADAAKVRAVKATASLFGLLGVRPAVGRFYTPDEDGPAAPPVAVLSHELWIRRYGADPDVLERRLRIGDHRYRVVGVAPAGFTGADLEPVDVWLPLVGSTHLGGPADVELMLERPGNRWLHGVARRAPGADEARALERASAAVVGLRAERVEEGSFDPEATVVAGPVVAARGPNPGAEVSVARWLGAVSLIVLLVACANVANLLLARAARWRRELAVRVALGVSRGRLLAQLLVESAVLAGLGAAAAFAIARVGGPALHRVLLPDVAFTDAGLGGRLLAFLTVAAGVTAILAGLVPALRASSPGASEALAGARTLGGGRGSRTRTALLVGQATLSVVLLVGAGLFVRSLHRAGAVDHGYDADRLVVAELEWSRTLPGARRKEIYEASLARVRRLPSVADAALTYTMPFWSSVSIGPPRVAGVDAFPVHPAGGPYLNIVSSRYFETMGLAVVEGRPFRAADDHPDAGPVAVVSASMAADLWPAGRATGRCLFFGEESPCTEVVGVVEDHTRESVREAGGHHAYYVNFPHPDLRGPPQGMMVRGPGDPAALAAEIAAEIRSSSGDVRFVHARPLEALIDPQLRSWRLGAAMFTVFGLLALLVATVGLYSVLAFEVASRRGEIGLRAALGAPRSRILGSVVRRGAALALVGIGLGLALAWAGARFVEPLLFRTSPVDPLVYGGVALALVAGAALAALLPGWRATRVPPAVTLRGE